MSQGLIVGSTNYQEQTKEDIALDIEKWIKNAKEMKDTMDISIAKLNNANYWKCVPFEFRNYCESVSSICSLFYSDFNLILSDIRKDHICERTIKLLMNIYNVSKENEEQSWKTYKKDSDWKAYGNQNFAVAEKLYEDSRDFFATLFDVANAAARLSDYIGGDKKEIHYEKTIHNDNSIRVGDNNKINNSQIGVNCTSGISKEKKSGVSKIFWNIIIPIIVGVAITAICFWLGFKGE